MSRAQKIALVVIWLGILGSIAAVLFSWQVGREWMDPGGYMLVRRNLLTTEEDVLINGQWVPLPGFRRSGPTLLAKQPPQSGEPPETDPHRPALPTRAPAPDLLGEPDRSLQQAKVPPAPPIRPRAPVRVRVAPEPDPPEAAAPPVDDGAPRAAQVDPDLPVVRAPSPDEVPAVAAPPSPPPDQVASADNGATVSASDQANPAASAPDQTQQATAPPACDPAAPGAVC